MITESPHPVLKPNLFCHSFPVTDWSDFHAVKLCISKAARAKLNEIPRGEEHIREGIVAYDKISRKWWAIRHFPCFIDSFDCCCAAQAMRLEDKNSKVEWPAIEFPETDEEDDD